MYNIFTFGAEYIDRKEDKRYLNNIENYNLYVLISKSTLADGEQMFSKSNLVNTISLPKVVVSKGYKEKLGSESIITEGFVDGDERLGIAFNETNIDADSKTVFVPYEVYFDAEKEENEKYNSEFTFNIEDYKNKILILVPKIDNYDDWRIFKAGERHKFFVAYFNFESVSDDENAYFWIIANNKDFDIVKTDYFYTDSTDVQDFNTALTSIETKFEGGSPTIYKIASDKGFIVKKDADDNIPFKESIIWLSEERDGENIFNLLNQDANYLKLSITKIQGSNIEYNYTGDDVEFYKDNIKISFDDFDEDGNYYLLSKFNIDGDLLITIKDASGNILDSQNVYEIFNGSDSIDAVLLNDLHTVACESDGTPTNENWANNAKTGIKVFKGGREVTDFTVLKNEVLSEPSGNTFTFDDVNKIFKCTSLNADSVVYDIPIYYGNITMNKKFKVIKQKKGATGEDGEDATLYRLIATNGNILKEDGTTTIKIVKNSGDHKQIITNLSDLDLALYVDDGSGGYTLLEDEEVREYEKQVNYNEAINGFNVYLASYVGELNQVEANLYDSIKVVSLVDLVQYKIGSDNGNIFKDNGTTISPDEITLSIKKFSNGIAETYNGGDYVIKEEDDVTISDYIIPSSRFDSIDKLTYELIRTSGKLVVDTFTIIKMSEPATNYRLITTNGTTLKYGENTTVKIVKEVGNGRKIVESGDIRLYWSDSSGNNYEKQVSYSDAINGFTITLEDKAGTTNILYDSIKIVSLVDLVQYKIVSNLGNIFKYDGSGYFPDAITLSIRKFSNGFSETYSDNDYKIYKEDDNNSNFLNPPITIDGSEFNDSGKITYKLREYNDSISGDIVDTFTITKLSDGVDGESIEISYFVDTSTEMGNLITTSPYLTTSNIGEICYVSDDQMIYFLESDGLGGVKWGNGLKFGKGKDAINVILSNDTISIPYYSTGAIKDTGNKYITVSAFQGITSVPLEDYEILSNSIDSVGGTFERDSVNNKKLNFTDFNAGENVATCSFDVELTIGEAAPETVPKKLRVFKQIDGIDGINSIQYKLFTVGGEVLKTGSTIVKVMKIDGARRTVLKNNDTTDGVFMFNNSNAVIDKNSSSDDYSTTVYFSGDETEKIIYLRNGNDSVMDDIIDSIKINKIADGVDGENSIQYKLFTVGGEVLKTGSTIVKVMKINGASRTVLKNDDTDDVIMKDNDGTKINKDPNSHDDYQFTVKYNPDINGYTVVLEEGSTETEIDSIKIAMIKDGIPSYVHIKFSDYSNGNQFDNVNTREYMGIATTNSETAPVAYGAYIWTKHKGSDGDSNYIHVAYCNDPDSIFPGNNSITQNPNEYSKFMATVVNNNIEWYSSYFNSESNWTRFVGNDSIYAVLTSETDNYKKEAETENYPATTIELYKGGVKLTRDVKYFDTGAVVGGTFSFSNSNATATFNGFDDGSESASIVLTAEYDNNNYSKTYTVTKVSDGLSGIPSYTYFGYADDDTGAEFSTSPIGKTYMATLVTNVKITRELVVSDFNECIWFKFKGETGDDAVLYKIVSDNGNIFKYDSSDSSYEPLTINLSIKEFSGVLGQTYNGTDLSIYKEDSENPLNLVDGIEPNDIIGEKNTYILKGTKSSQEIIDSFTIIKMSDGVDGEDGENSVQYKLFTVGGEVLKTGSTIVKVMKIDGDSRTVLQNNHADNVIMRDNDSLTIDKNGTSSHYQYEVNYDSAINDCLITLFEVFGTEYIEIDSIKIAMIKDGEMGESPTIYKIISDGGFLVKSNDFEDIPLNESIIWFAEERDGSTIFNELDKESNFLKLSIMKSQGLSTTSPYIDESDPPQIRFYKNDSLIPFTNFDENDQYNMSKLNSDEKTVFSIRDASGNILDTQVVYKIYDGGDGATGSIYKPTGIDTDGSIIWGKQSDNESEDEITLSNTIFATKEEISLKENKKYHFEVETPIATWEEGANVSTMFALKYGDETVPVSELSMTSVSTGGSFTTDYPRLYFAVFDDDSNFATKTITITHSSGIYTGSFIVLRGAEDAIFVNSTNETYSVPCLSNGTFPSGTLDDVKTVISAYKGASITDFEITSISDTTHFEIDTDGATVKCKAMSSDVESCVISVEVGSLTIEKKFIVTKQKQGFVGTPGTPGKDSVHAILTSETDTCKVGETPSTTIELYQGGAKLTSGVTYLNTGAVIGGAFERLSPYNTATFNSFTGNSESASIVLTARYDGNYYSKTYTVTKVSDGLTGIPSYTYFGYANDDDGTGFSTSPIGKTYMATLVTNVEKTTITSADFNECTWFKFKGEDGDDSVEYKISSFGGSVFKSSNGSFSPQTITLQIIRTEGDSRAILRDGNSNTYGVYIYKEDEATKLTNLVIQSSEFSGVEKITYKLVDTSNSSNVVLDSFTITKVTDGVDGESFDITYRKTTLVERNAITGVIENETCFVSETKKLYFAIDDGSGAGIWDDGVEFGSGDDAISVILSRDTINIPYLYSGAIKDDSSAKYITVSAFSGFNEIDSDNFEITSIKDSTGGSFYIPVANNKRLDFNGFIANSDVAICNFNVSITDGSTISDILKTLTVNKIVDGIDGADGADGTDGLSGADGNDGIDGIDGISSYVHIKFSDNSNGNPFDGDNTREYMGIATTNSETAPLDYGAYIWTKHKGIDGSDGINGTNGLSGTDGNDGIDGADATNFGLFTTNGEVLKDSSDETIVKIYKITGSSRALVTTDEGVYLYYDESIVTSGGINLYQKTIDYAMAGDGYTIELRDGLTYLGSNLLDSVKIVSISDGIDGSDGDDAILYKIISSDGSTFKYNSSDSPPFYPSTMNLIIKEINGKISSTYSGASIKVYNENGIAVNLSSSLDISAYLTLNEKYTFTLKDTANSNAVLDSFTIVKLSDGSDGDNAINYTLSSVGGGVFKSSDGGTSYEPTTIELIINKIDGSSRTKILETNTDFKIRKFGETTSYLSDFTIEPDDVVGNQVYELVDVSDVSNIIVLDSLSIVKVTDGIKIESILTGVNTILYIPMTNGVVGINQDLSTFSDVEAWNNLGIEGGLVSDSYSIIGGVNRYLKITKELTQSINGKISFSFLYKPTEIINGSAPESSLFSLYGVESNGQIDKKIAIIFTSRHYVDGTSAEKIEIKYYYYEDKETKFTSSGVIFSDFYQKTESSDFNHFVIGVDDYSSSGFTFNMSINNMKHEYTMNLSVGYSIEKFDFLTLGLYDNRNDYFGDEYNSLPSDSAFSQSDVSYYYDEFRILSTSLSGENIGLIYNNDGKIDNMLSAYLTNSVPDLLPSLNKTKYLDGSGYDSSNLNIGQMLFNKEDNKLYIMTSDGLKTITIS